VNRRHIKITYLLTAPEPARGLRVSVIHRLVLAFINLLTKSEYYIFTDSKDKRRIQNLQAQLIRDAVPSLCRILYHFWDRVNYLWKIINLSYPTSVWCPRWGCTRLTEDAAHSLNDVIFKLFLILAAVQAG